jgi:hypothetical protein
MLKTMVYDGKVSRDILVLSETSDSITGIDFAKLPKDEAKELLAIFEDFLGKTSKFLKGYRHFKINKINSIHPLSLPLLQESLK